MPVKLKYIIPEEMQKDDKAIYFCDFLLTYKQLEVEINKRVFCFSSQDDFTKKILLNNPLKNKGFKEQPKQEQELILKVVSFKKVGEVSKLVYDEWKLKN